MLDKRSGIVCDPAKYQTAGNSVRKYDFVLGYALVDQVVLGKKSPSSAEIPDSQSRRLKWNDFVTRSCDHSSKTALCLLRGLATDVHEVARQTRVELNRGREMAEHAKLTENTGMKVYFCDPYKPWQRGSNENINGLLRQYLPKGTDLSGYIQQQLDAVADELNGCPRMTLGYSTPLGVYAKHLQHLTQQSDSVH